MQRPRSVILPGLLVLVLLLAGCGGTTGADRPETEPSVLLDSAPNGVHAGFYLASARGFDTAEGVSLRIRTPRAAADPLERLRAGRADFAILGIDDLGLARERGADVVGVMAVVQRPLAAVLAEPGVRSPEDLEGRRVGVPRGPSGEAVLRSVVRGAGGDPRRVRETTIGGGAVEALVDGRVDAATASWHVEGVALRARVPGAREFRVDDFGAPSHPGLVLCVTRTTLEDRPEEVRAVIRALQRGYGETQKDPSSAVSAMLERERNLDRAALAAQLDAVAPAFTAGVPAYGVLDPRSLDAWAAWAVESGLLARRPDVGRAFATGLVGPIDGS